MSDRTPKGPLYVISTQAPHKKWREVWVGSSRRSADKHLAAYRSQFLHKGYLVKLTII